MCVCVCEPAFEMYISKNAGLCLLIIIRYKRCTLPPHMATVFYVFAASACLSYDIEQGASAKNTYVNCSAGSTGIINCTVTCKDNFAFQDGTTTMSYDCQGSNEWQPALPAQSCVRKLASLCVCVCVFVCVCVHVREGETDRQTDTESVCAFVHGKGCAPQHSNNLP